MFSKLQHHTPTHYLPTYLLSTYQPMHLCIYLHTYPLPPTHSPIHPFTYLPPSHHSESNNVQKRLVMILSEDDEKILGFNINLTIGKHCNIISMNENLKS